MQFYYIFFHENFKTKTLWTLISLLDGKKSTALISLLVGKYVIVVYILRHYTQKKFICGSVLILNNKIYCITKELICQKD